MESEERRQHDEEVPKNSEKTAAKLGQGNKGKIHEQNAYKPA
jgi:hypothetical protein